MRSPARGSAHRLLSDRGSVSWPPASIGWQRVFLLVVLLQAGHFGEHIIQVIQTFVLHYTAAHGLIGAGLDTEELHLAFNAALFVAMIALLAGCGFVPRLRQGSGGSSLVVLFAAGTLLQGYHAAEHIVRLVNYQRTGVSPQLGILGQWVDLTWLHFSLVALAFAALLAGFSACGGMRLLRMRETTS